MKYVMATALALSVCFATFSDSKAASAALNVTSKSIEHGKPIPKKFAYCMPDGKGKSTSAENISPELSWSGAPKEAKSFAIVVVDPDVPAKFDDANKDGKTIAEDFPRKNFYHWVVINIPANVSSFSEGEGKEVIMNSFPNKPPFSYKNGGIPLINDFSGGKNAPEFAGYDGPCPPWNDARLHHYRFTVYALSQEKLEIDKNATLANIVSTIQHKSIGKGEIVGTYSNYLK